MTERETLIWIQGYLEGHAFLSDSQVKTVKAKILEVLKPKFKLDLDEINSWRKQTETVPTPSPYRGFPYGDVMCSNWGSVNNPEEHF